jgi:hypothetical protein
MADGGDISFCPARADPYSHVQYADFSRVQFLEIKDSEDEMEMEEDGGMLFHLHECPLANTNKDDIRR